MVVTIPIQGGALRISREGIIPVPKSEMKTVKPLEEILELVGEIFLENCEFRKTGKMEYFFGRSGKLKVWLFKGSPRVAGGEQIPDNVITTIIFSQLSKNILDTLSNKVEIALMEVDGVLKVNIWYKGQSLIFTASPRIASEMKNLHDKLRLITKAFNV
mgnify:CR=1 FL=1